ncbi:MAG: GntR family transcriptional regulator [Pelolinea sp.]|nr:GntR family transcriptional regulator [Pelolinea sp.]
MPKTQQPLYLQIEEALRDMIDGIEYEPGDQIPSEREIAEKLKASRMTVRRAVEMLTAQGYLERRSTSGTYVSEPKVIRTFTPGSVQSLTRQIQGKGGAAGSKLLSFDEIPAPAKVAKYLRLRSGSPVYIIQRLRLTSGFPFCIETSYLPKEIFNELSKGDVSSQNSLYDYLKQRYGIIPARSTDKLKITWPTEQEVELLGLSMNDPVLYFRSVVFNSDGLPFEFVKSINHPQRVAFQSETTMNEIQPKITETKVAKDPD